MDEDPSEKRYKVDENQKHFPFLTSFLSPGELGVKVCSVIKMGSEVETDGLCFVTTICNVVFVYTGQSQGDYGCFVQLKIATYTCAFYSVSFGMWPKMRRRTSCGDFILLHFYNLHTQSLPYIFVGKSDRLGQIVSIVFEATKQSLKKKGMHLPPCQKTDYMRAKWLSPHSRKDPIAIAVPESESEKVKSDLESQEGLAIALIFGEKSLPSENDPGGAAAEKAFPADEKISSEPVTA
ncbi:hypothetical protein F8388_014084 [Cannabis sativa]|uniref:Uncharacterized protein n=1 Tax=Cannabis sativa TaxID=3483 RepID=A0A7J6GKX9_CANSA|nr:hypothetical protein F8388_014084 [Cannabis sativa]